MTDCVCSNRRVSARNTACHEQLRRGSLRPGSAISRNTLQRELDGIISQLPNKLCIRQRAHSSASFPFDFPHGLPPVINQLSSALQTSLSFTLHPLLAHSATWKHPWLAFVSPLRLHLRAHPLCQRIYVAPARLEVSSKSDAFNFENLSLCPCSSNLASTLLAPWTSSLLSIRFDV